MEKLTCILSGCFLLVLTSSCAIQKDFALLDKQKLEIVNNTIESKCLNKFDNAVLIAVLQKNSLDYMVENNDIYVEKRVMDKRDFFDDINRDIQDNLLDKSIPRGYVPFKYRRLNTRINEYETRPLDDLDKALLPDIIKRGGFKHILKNDCLYVERELIDNQDFLSKAVHMLDFKRGDEPFE